MKDIYKNLEKQLNSKVYEFLKIYTYRSYRLFGRDYFCDICLVKNRESNKVFIRLQKRWFGISKKMKKAGEGNARWIVIKAYNFPQKYEFERARIIFNKISKGEISETKKPVDIGGVNLAVDEIKNLNVRLKKLRKIKRKDKKNREEIERLKDQINFLDVENKVLKKDRIKSQIPEFRTMIKYSISNLDNGKNENFFQELFTENNWIFGPSYEDVIPKRKADPENQPDFILKRYDGFCDIVEIEKPNKPLFTKPDKSGKSQVAASLSHAISQTMDYIDSYNTNYYKLFYQDYQKNITNPVHAYHPRGFVIIGRDKNTDRKKLRQLNSFLHNIIVLTYDEFLNQSERMINILHK